MEKVRIYTDGSCHQMAASSGHGGYGVILIFENGEVELSGSEAVTTNNRMEIFAAIAGLEHLKEPHDVKLYSDSAYLVECFRKHWYLKWLKNGWVNSAGKPVANKDLWIRLMENIVKHKIEFIKVKGHSDDEYNNRCDVLAKIAGTKKEEGNVS